MRQTALKNERQIEADDVVADEFITVRVEIFHEVDELLQCWLFVLLITLFVDSKHMLVDGGTEFRKLQTRDRTDVKRKRQHSSGSRAQRAERVAALFLRGNVFEVTLLLFDAHIAEPHRTLELWPHSFTKVRQRYCFDVERVSPRQSRIGVLMFTVLLERDWPVLRDDKLRAVLESFELTSDAPETGLDAFLSFENFTPDFESECAGGISRGGVAEETALLRPALSHGRHEDHQPEILAVGNFGDGDVASQDLFELPPH